MSRNSFMRAFGPIAATLILAASLAACDDPTKEHILKKSEGAHNRESPEAALGRPDDISKTGSRERWTYDAANGTGILVLAGDLVTMSSTGDKKAADGDE